MNEYKAAWLNHCGQMSNNIVNDVIQMVNDVQESITDWHKLSPTDPKRMIAHIAALPIAVGADALATGVFATGMGPGLLAVGASTVAVAALAYFVYSGYQLYTPIILEIIENSDLKYFFA